MRRILIILHDRRATTFLMSMLLGRPGEFTFGEKSFGEVECPIWVNTIPPNQLKFFSHGDRKLRTIEDMIMARPAVSIPEAYSWISPADLRPEFYDSLPGNDWRIIYSFRDPRNVISSLCKRTKLDENKLWPIFKEQCRYLKSETNHLIQMRDDSRFFVLQFEKFIKNPLEVLTLVFNHMGFNIDKEFYTDLINQYTSNYINSSYKDNGRNSNLRWVDWPSNWIEYYKEELIPNLEKLGIREYLQW